MVCSLFLFIWIGGFDYMVMKVMLVGILLGVIVLILLRLSVLVLW